MINVFKYNIEKGDYFMYNRRMMRPIPMNGDRFGGGFFGPFLLGGITRGLLAPAFYPRPYPVPYNPYPPYPNYPVYY